ncbi:hypothetical protein ES707_19864 [subsurface metagenome]
MVTKSTTKKTGRSTKLTPELQKKICGIVAKGNYFSTACEISGIAVSTLYKWMERGTDKTEKNGTVTPAESPYKEFVAALKKAEGEAEAERVSRIRAAGKGGAITKIIRYTRKDGTEVEETNITRPAWEADMTHLERRSPKKWGKRDRQEVTGKGGGPVIFKVEYDDDTPPKK